MPKNEKTVWLPRDLHSALKVRSAVTGRSISDLLTCAVRAYLAMHPAPDEPKPPDTKTAR